MNKGDPSGREALCEEPPYEECTAFNESETSAEAEQKEAEEESKNILVKPCDRTSIELGRNRRNNS